MDCARRRVCLHIVRLPLAQGDGRLVYRRLFRLLADTGGFCLFFTCAGVPGLSQTARPGIRRVLPGVWSASVAAWRLVSLAAVFIVWSSASSGQEPGLHHSSLHPMWSNA
jgi:hypothetical protein